MRRGSGQHEPAGIRRTRLFPERSQFTRFPLTTGERPAVSADARAVHHAACDHADLAGRLTHGRLTDAHDEVLYVIRKPEERFARVV